MPFRPATAEEQRYQEARPNKGPIGRWEDLIIATSDGPIIYESEEAGSDMDLHRALRQVAANKGIKMSIRRLTKTSWYVSRVS